MKINYWGVRGSIPTPGPETVRYGGNTSCVSVEAGNQLLILDAGTGIRVLGKNLLSKEFGKGAGNAHILLSHYHWDHIQGFPFFIPGYIPGNKLHLHGERRVNETVEDQIKKQQAPPNFPEGAKFRANLEYHTLKEWGSFELGDKVKITCAQLNHSNGVTSYRIEHEGKVLVYATDTEHYAVPDWKLAKLAKDADLLIYDGQYLPEEYPQKTNWGHSTYEEGIKIAKLAGVKELHLFHHDPEHNDDCLDGIVAKAKELFPNTKAAKEGMIVPLGSQATRRLVKIANELKTA